MPDSARMRSVLAFCGLAVCSSLNACKQADDAGFQCINDGDCPPACSCQIDFVAIGVCENGGKECGGSCDRESTCPEGTECVLDQTRGDVEIYACLGPMLGDLGADCQSNAECDPNASSLGAFCCLDATKCGGNLNQCIEDCSDFSSGGEVGTVEGSLCQDNSECAPDLFCCLVPDAAGNCDFELDQSCTCRSPQ